MTFAYDLILFDYDGTLVHSMPSIEHATRRTFEAAGLPSVAPEQMHSAIRDGKGLEFYLKILHPSLKDDEIEPLKQRWREMYEAEAHPFTKPYPGAAQTLARLAEADIPLAVFSNKGQPALVRSAEENGLDGFFKLMIGDLPGQPKKPHAEAFHDRVAPQLPGLDPARVLMVGDAESDLKFGANFGGKTCLATYGYGNMDECLAEQPTLVISAITELADAVLAARQ